MVKEVQPDSRQHQAELVVCSPPSLEGQGRLSCFIWTCNGKEAEVGGCGIQKHMEKRKIPVWHFAFSTAVKGSLLCSSLSQSTSGTAVLAGSKQRDTAPQVIPMADDRAGKDRSSPNPPCVGETTADQGWLPGQAGGSSEHHEVVGDTPAHTWGWKDIIFKIPSKPFHDSVPSNSAAVMFPRSFPVDLKS